MTAATALIVAAAGSGAPTPTFPLPTLELIGEGTSCSVDGACD